MMMERAKTAPAPSPPPEETKKTTTAVSVVAVAGGGVSEEEQRIRDLERRLKSLDGVDEGAVASSASTPVVVPPPQQASIASSSSSSSAAKNDPLLKRIQAAQERTRLAEQREREAAASLIAAEAERKRVEEDAIAAEEERSRIRRAQDALRSVAGRALEDKQRQAFTTTKTTMPGAASMAVPIMKSMDPPPPSFDSMKFPPPMMMSFTASSASDGPAMMVGHGMNSRALTREEAPRPPPPPPPPFDFMIAPSAPPITPTEEGCESDHLLGVMPIAAPTLMPEMPQQQQQHQHQHVQVDAPPPPSFAEFESLRQSSHSNMTSAAELEEAGSSIFDYDDAGNPMSPERRRALLDEQRLLYEQIMTEKAANDEAIARANADLFDMKSSTSAARAMPGGEDSLAARMDWVGRDVASGAVADAVGKNGTGDGVVGTSTSTSSSSTGRMVKIGNNQMVALHGQDRTKKAIKEGTAILVQCINCQNWMQVTDTASLMFCPVCQVVSPVIKQSEVLTKEEAIQLTMDRKLAEKLQAEYNNHDIEDDAEEEGGGKSADDEGYLARFFGSGVSKYPAARVGKSSPTAQTEGADSSWWDKITSIVSHGVADEGPKERGELGVTRPPGTASRQRRGAESSSSASSSPVAVHDRVAGRDEETTGLLGPVVVDGNEANLPAARVAEQRPLFSCVMDSVSSATSALWSSTGEGDREGNVYGVDASSLLVTNAGRGVGDGASDYAQLSDRE